MRCILFAFLVLGTLRADTITELRQKLESMKADASLQAEVSLQVIKKSDDDPAEKKAEAKVLVTETGAGLSLTWPGEILAKVRDERGEKLKNPEAQTPTRSALGSFDLDKAYDYLHAADGLLKKLDQAELTSETTTNKDGRAVRQLNFKITPKLSAKDKKYIKELEATATLFLTEDGVPLEAQTRIHVRGRAFLVISFESEEKEEFSFEKVGERLVITRHQRDSKGSGAGEKNEQHTSATCKVAKL